MSTLTITPLKQLCFLASPRAVVYQRRKQLSRADAYRLSAVPRRDEFARHQQYGLSLHRTGLERIC
jgi:hypothetical protein